MKYRIAFIEDDPMVMEVNSQYVEKIGGFHVVGKSAKGKDGIDMVLEVNPDVLILDVFLPDTSGIQVLEQIRLMHSTTDVILVTAASDKESVQQAFRLGAIDYIIKPFRFERLQEALLTYQNMRECTDRLEVLTQEEIDSWSTVQKKILRPTSTGSVRDLPKGLNHTTLRQILLYLMKENRPLSAEEVAEGIGIARVTARRYLDYLEKNEQVELVVQYGTIGRPLNKYWAK